MPYQSGCEDVYVQIRSLHTCWPPIEKPMAHRICWIASSFVKTMYCARLAAVSLASKKTVRDSHIVLVRYGREVRTIVWSELHRSLVKHTCRNYMQQSPYWTERRTVNGVFQSKSVHKIDERTSPFENNAKVTMKYFLGSSALLSPIM